LTFFVFSSMAKDIMYVRVDVCTCVHIYAYVFPRCYAVVFECYRMCSLTIKCVL